MCGVNWSSVMESWCQSTEVSGNGGLSRGKGRASGSGLDVHLDWKIEGRESSSIWGGEDIMGDICRRREVEGCGRCFGFDGQD